MRAPSEGWRKENGGTEDDSVNMFRPSIGSVVRRGNRERKKENKISTVVETREEK